MKKNIPISHIDYEMLSFRHILYTTQIAHMKHVKALKVNHQC